MKRLLLAFAFSLWSSLAAAAVPCTLPFNLQNGTTADATQVMANYNALVTCLESAAASGANTDITALLGLTTPISPTVGGANVFLGGTSAGTANAQTVATTTPTGFALSVGYTVVFVAGATNTTAMTLLVNAQTVASTTTPACSTGTCPPALYRQSPSGPIPMTGGEVQAGQIIVVQWDGTQFEMISNGPQYGGFGPQVTTASTTTLNLGVIGSHNVITTGTTAITNFGATAAVAFPVYRVQFSGQVITYNQTSCSTTGGCIGTPTNANITTASGDSADVIYLGNGSSGGGNWYVTRYITANGIPLNFNASYLQNYISGLTLSAAGSTGTFGIAAGEGVDSTNSTAMLLASAFTKTTASWVVGTGNGCLDTGSIGTTTWYHAFLIQGTGLAPDVLCSLSATSPTMPSGYTLFRRIGSMKTDSSSHWLAFTQNGDQFTWQAIVTGDYSGTPGTGSRTTIALTVPTGVVVIAQCSASGVSPGSSVAYLFTSLIQNDIGAGGTIADLYVVTSGGSAVNFSRVTNTSAQIGVRGSAGAGITINTYGWIDTRGKQ